MTVASHLKASVLTLTLLTFLLPTLTIQAQIAINPGVDKIAPGLHLSARIGVGYYGGDLDAVNSDTENTKRAFALDLLYHITPKIGVVASVQSSNYARIVDPLDLTTTSFLVRYAPFSGRISPYLQGGFHRTYGGKETGSGPSGGLGLSLAITPKIHFFQEVNANFVGPDIAIDNSEGGSGFDILGFLGGGIRIANIGVKYARRAKIDKIVYPSEIRSNAAEEFLAKIDKKASQPVIVTWDFGDGVVEKGNPILHAFPHAGVFTVKVFAENSGGTDMKEAEVTVLHGMDRPVLAGTVPRSSENDFVPENADPQQAYELALLSVQQAEVALENARRALAAISQNDLQSIESRRQEPQMAAADTEGPLSDLTESDVEAVRSVEVDSVKVKESPKGREEDKEMENTAEVDGPVIAVVLGSEEIKAQEDSEIENESEPDSPLGGVVQDHIPESEIEEDMKEKQVESGDEPVSVQPTLEEQSDEPEYFIRLDEGWSIVVASELSFTDARSVMADYLSEGYNCEIMPARSGDKLVYRVTIGQYVDRSEADRMRSEFFKYEIPQDAWLYQFDRSKFSNLWEL